MSAQNFFPQKPNATPIIYGYTEPNNPELKGLIKVGYTSRTIDERMREHYPTLKPGAKPYDVVFLESAVRSDGTSFLDHPVHDKLEQYGHKRLRDAAGKKTEWVRCTVDELRAAWLAVRDRADNDEQRTQDFSMRPEQRRAVEKTLTYFQSVERENLDRAPKFLWNAKMRFGKTFAAYQLAKRMEAKRVLVLTFKPAVQAAWYDDLMCHVDFEGWQFVTRDGLQFDDADPSRPIVCFGSFQDFMGRDKSTGGIKPRNEWVHLTKWDLVVFDEYHFGAWNENSKNLFVQEDEDELNTEEEKIATAAETKAKDMERYDETYLPIETSHYLFLSGTPFRALASGEFIEEQIYNWTYSDEQAAKKAWTSTRPAEPNPYASLPRMVMLTYKMPDEIVDVARGGEYDSFDLNAFFEAKGEGASAEFVMKEHVQKWLNLIRGSYLPQSYDSLRSKAEKPALPYSHTDLLNVLNHTVWYLPRVNSCYAMRNLLNEPQNTFFQDYRINVAAGLEAGVGLAALERVQETMQDPLKSKTITLTCGKLTTGVTVKPWTGIFMLTNMKSPETYFQAAFRVQSPWTVKNDSGGEEIVKQECYVFDFALDRSLRMVSDYSCRLSTGNVSPEQKVGEFIDFLPVLAYDGSSMKQVSATEILDIAMAGTSATLLARRWESACLVNVDNATLARILANEEAMRALMSIEGFRSLNRNDIETIINKSEAVKKAKKQAAEEGREFTDKEKRKLSEEEKEYKSKRKMIQEKLIKFATRIPVFMYLTDFREQTLYDVITQLESGLFYKVTGLSIKEFELLVSLGVFDNGRMNDAVYKFRRYEDASLVYTGINKHQGEHVGLFDTALSEFDYLEASQQDSLILPNGLDKRRKKSRKSDEASKDKSTCDSGNSAPQNAVKEAANGAGTQIDPSSDQDVDDWLIAALEDAGLNYIDKRGTGGNLWVIGGRELVKTIDALQKRGAHFKYRKGGGKATGGTDAWWVK
ncbi:GIY-YIG nuclease family protein [uncultured Adlercreutzia sp.]|uniref:GIY-YIG nuclease family protein n=1 Tax=uncultured Adlercreutzia sp. TaxID=875803 RepID=UPI00258945AE|nr:GIY-YIG nuclease family protein [uncultured Adlercreutzia sp.]